MTQEQPSPQTPPPESGSARLGGWGWFALVVLAGFLGFTGWYAVYAWDQLPSVSISPLGWVFMVAGVLTTVIVGAGLMGLVFYSSRKGRDF